MLNTLQRGVLALSIATLLCFASMLYGASIVQKKWDTETAKREESARIAAATNKTALEAERKRNEEILTAAKSQAGRDAVAAWLRAHRVLSAGVTVQPTKSSAENQSASGTDAATAKCGTSGSTTGIEEFAMKCAIDADHVIRWQQFILANPQAFEIE